MKLFILIPSIPERKALLVGLIKELRDQAERENIQFFPIVLNSTTCRYPEVIENTFYPTKNQMHEIVAVVYVTEPHKGFEGSNQCIGVKRNELKGMVKYKKSYQTFIDDDDFVEPDYLKLIFEAMKQEPDVISINGTLIYASGLRCNWEMGLGFERKFIELSNNNGRTFYAPPNHLAVYRSEIVRGYDFMQKNHGEDTEWADRLRDEGVLKTEIRITQPIYRYVFTKQ